MSNSEVEAVDWSKIIKMCGSFKEVIHIIIFEWLSVSKSKLQKTKNISK